MAQKYLISIIGPTAVGKTSLSIALAKHFKTEIISCDSRQMYRYMNIGTAKPDMKERAGIPHHFIDYLNPDQAYTAGQFEEEAEKLIEELFQKHDVLIVVGGSTLYIQALWEGIDEMPEIIPEVRAKLRQKFVDEGLPPLLEELEKVDSATFEKIDRHNHVRVLRALEVFHSSGNPISFYRNRKKQKSRAYQCLNIGLKMDREILYQRINQRVDTMLEAGLKDEVKSLLKMGYSRHQNALNSIGYEEMIAYLQREIDRNEAIRLIKRNSRRYAKRQFTFFRRFENISWFEAGNNEIVLAWIKERTPLSQ